MREMMQRWGNQVLVETEYEEVMKLKSGPFVGACITKEKVLEIWTGRGYEANGDGYVEFKDVHEFI
jgi:hypothetical protein